MRQPKEFVKDIAAYQIARQIIICLSFDMTESKTLNAIHTDLMIPISLSLKRRNKAPTRNKLLHIQAKAVSPSTAEKVNMFREVVFPIGRESSRKILETIVLVFIGNTLSLSADFSEQTVVVVLQCRAK